MFFILEDKTNNSQSLNSCQIYRVTYVVRTPDDADIMPFLSTWSNNIYFLNFGVIHKPRGQLRGMGVSQMTTLLHKPYL